MPFGIAASGEEDVHNVTEDRGSCVQGGEQSHLAGKKVWRPCFRGFHSHCTQ